MQNCMNHAVEPLEPPPEALSRTTLDRIDYADAFRVVLDAPVDPEAFARALLEDAPAARRASLLAGWTALGLRLGSPAAADRVLGWRVARSAPDHVLLDARSPLGLDGQLLVAAEPSGVLFATLVRLRTPIARAVWAPVVAPHQRIVRELLTAAAERVASRTG